MNNQEQWDDEYKNPRFISLSHKPQKDFLRFIKWLKKNKNIDFTQELSVLDLGTGVGRNSFYMADNYDAKVYAYDFSGEALEQARLIHAHPRISFVLHNIAEPYDLPDDSIDIILDVTSSNALNEKERAVYLAECQRVLKKGGYLYVRTLAKEGDTNAQKMIQEFPGGEKDTYIHPIRKIRERVFSGPDFKKLYGNYFKVIRMERKTGYQRWGKQNYKRNYWNVYLKSNKGEEVI